MKQSVRLAQIFRKDIREVLEKIALVFMSMPSVLLVKAEVGITMDGLCLEKKWRLIECNF